MREHIKNIIQNITPLDTLEANTIESCINWIDSGEEIFRLAKPATPPKHLVSYFLLVDGEYVLLVDHIKAELWLPSGGHVEKDEDPKVTAIRECEEELNVEAEFIFNNPIFITKTVTQGKTAGHTDVSLWYVLKGDRKHNYKFDTNEFKSIQWFHMDDIPYENSDPHMRRFIRKLKSAL